MTSKWASGRLGLRIIDILTTKWWQSIPYQIITDVITFCFLIKLWISFKSEIIIFPFFRKNRNHNYFLIIARLWGIKMATLQCTPYHIKNPFYNPIFFSARFCWKISGLLLTRWPYILIIININNIFSA
jgi:hypothetical protein